MSNAQAARHFPTKTRSVILALALGTVFFLGSAYALKQFPAHWTTVLIPKQNPTETVEDRLQRALGQASAGEAFRDGAREDLVDVVAFNGRHTTISLIEGEFQPSFIDPPSSWELACSPFSRHS
jgi:hypothetical protein